MIVCRAFSLQIDASWNNIRFMKQYQVMWSIFFYVIGSLSSSTYLPVWSARNIKKLCSNIREIHWSWCDYCLTLASSTLLDIHWSFFCLDCLDLFLSLCTRMHNPGLVYFRTFCKHLIWWIRVLSLFCLHLVFSTASTIWR
jgi:hypothetical protein